MIQKSVLTFTKETLRLLEECGNVQHTYNYMYADKIPPKEFELFREFRMPEKEALERLLTANRALVTEMRHARISGGIGDRLSISNQVERINQALNTLEMLDDRSTMGFDTITVIDGDMKVMYQNPGCVWPIHVYPYMDLLPGNKYALERVCLEGEVEFLRYFVKCFSEFRKEVWKWIKKPYDYNVYIEE